jgi:hypothetical protein
VKKLVFVALGLLTPGLAAADDAAAVAPKEPTQASAAVRVGGLDFQVVGPARWLAPQKKTGPHAMNDTIIPLALRITNRTDKAVALELGTTVYVCLKDAAGKELPVFGGQDGEAALPPPLVVAPGNSGDIPRPGYLSLRREQDGGPLRLWGADETGFFWDYKNLKPGRYSVEIRYENAAKKTASVGSSGAPLWTGKAVTKPLAVEIVDQPTAETSKVAEDRTEGLPPVDRSRIDKAIRLADGDWLVYSYQITSDSGVQVYRIDPTMSKRRWQARCEGLGQFHGQFGQDVEANLLGAWNEVLITCQTRGGWGGEGKSFEERLNVATGKQIERKVPRK